MSTTKPPKFAGKLVKPPAKGATISTPGTRRVPKQFAITPYGGTADEGEKIVLYGKSGIGKTTLASLLPDAVFLPLDDGARKIVNPITGKPVNAVPNIETFQDLRDALAADIWPDKCSIVLDTITKVEPLAQQHIIETITIDGRRPTSFRKYGWDGERHLLDQYRLLLTDLEAHVRAGRNVILLAQLGQITVANAEGVDYLEDGPKLQHRKDCSVRTELCEWADHVFRVGYLDFRVVKEDSKAKAGKVMSNDSTRAIFTGGAQHFMAKTRPVLHNREAPYRIPPVIPFDNETDDSLWQFVFGGAVAAEEGDTAA